MTAIDKWKEKYPKQVEATLDEDPFGRKEIFLSKKLLINLFGCVTWAKNEAKWNWINYWPISTISGHFRTPTEIFNDIFYGKLIEFIFAMMHQDEIEQWPKVYSKESFVEYDMIFKNGDKYDVKSSLEAAKEHKKKFPYVKVAYPKDITDIENMEFIVI